VVLRGYLSGSWEGAVSTRLRVALIGACLAALALATPAHAAFPGANGKIAAVGNDEIWSMNADGTGQVQLTNDSGGSESAPAWSPDGSKIAFAVSGAIYTINSDGSNGTCLTCSQSPVLGNPGWSPDGTKIAFDRGGGEIWVMNADGSAPMFLAAGGDPAWSPDGSKIAFRGVGPVSNDIFTMNSDGSNRVNRTNDSNYDYFPNWSPDGTRIVFMRQFDLGTQVNDEIYTINADGTNPTNLTNNPSIDTQPSWSPDGTKIVFGSTRDGDPAAYTMNADGTNVIPLTNGAGFSEFDWQPIPINAYPRPKGATPLRISLVTANNLCTAPNRTHGAPLAFPSCSPVQLGSDQLTVGTGDSNGEPALAQPSLRLDVIPGNPATPQDEADVNVKVSINDVFKKDLSDYTGALRAVLPIQITDKLNTPSPGGPGAATSAASTFQVDVGCAATADTSAGSDCNLNTTFDSLVPGAVKEGVRSVWQLGQVQVYDGGADGVASTTGDNTLFMDQGVFVP
jgi:WD40-like Beta Propeller Repeat